jgi:hypothetical protein
MKSENAPDDVIETYGKLDARWQRLRWTITGPILILLGVTQAIFGWAGSSLWMRFGYAAACIAFGLILIAKINWLCPREDDEERAAIDAPLITSRDRASSAPTPLPPSPPGKRL